MAANAEDAGTVRWDGSKQLGLFVPHKNSEESTSPGLI